MTRRWKVAVVPFRLPTGKHALAQVNPAGGRAIYYFQPPLPSRPLVTRKPECKKGVEASVRAVSCQTTLVLID